MILFKGKKVKVGTVRTMDIKWDDIRAVFFPRNFEEKYRYLGSVYMLEDSDIFKVMEPLIIFMDYKARPKWCPRWFLRFLHLFGNDNSIVRVRNFRLSNLKSKLTKGIFLTDWKTKWGWYDLRISVFGDEQINDLAYSIESSFYRKGRRKELIENIKALEPDFAEDYLSIESLEKYYKNLKSKDK